MEIPSFMCYIFYAIGPLMLIIWFIQNARQRKGNQLIYIGIGFLLFSILAPLPGYFERSNIDENINGTYYIKGQNKIVLKLKSDKTFDSFGIDSLIKIGQGTWNIELGDTYELQLTSNKCQNCNRIFHINSSDNKIILTDAFGPTNLIKIRYSH